MVKGALEGLKGVQQASVSFQTKEARVVFDPALVSVEALIRAVDRLGFHASVKREAVTGDRPGEKPAQ